MTRWVLILCLAVSFSCAAGRRAASANQADPVKLTPQDYTVLLENDRVRVLDWHIKAGDKEPMHAHPDNVVYTFNRYQLKLTTEDGRVIEIDSKPGTAFMMPATVHAPENVGATDAHALQVELKPGPSDCARPQPRRILLQNRYWAKPGKGDEVYQWRLHASEVQAQLGLGRGEVFRGAGGDEPDAIAQRILDPEELEPMLKRQAEQMKAFEPVMAHMSTLIRGFERGRYEEVKHFENGDRVAK